MIATIKASQSNKMTSRFEDELSLDGAVTSLTAIIQSILECMMAQPRDEQSGLIKNYLDGETHRSAAWAFGDAAGTSLVTSTIYRLAVILPSVFMKGRYLSWADKNLEAIAHHVHEDGRVGPVARINGVPSIHAVNQTSEGQSMAILLYAARRDFLESGRWTRAARYWL